ncbi:glycosyltransferase family A protein [Haliea sp. E1-2-M8]|uniref:glycosyltransferase family 2 protein n=1 Tax=Haliea sp. E1-2-M8 TaxID=3064706 RepID=UPI00271723CE|nr:glycosyltransferase family A protein [Haliea sp. E1-2-M8]MDO8860413.1 glycosyltransferase family A protein [Haliea sp. E1-2-M8]
MSNQVSVIVPVYNAEQYIERCLDSIFRQTFQDLEIIATNDGSTDKSFEILREHSDSITILSQTNRGASSARNLGIREAAGKYIAFIDADDCWHPAKLQIQVRLMEENPQLLACYTGKTRELDLLALEINPDAPLKFSTKSLSDVFRSPYLGTSSFMIKRSVIDYLGGFDEALKTAEDIDLYLKVASQGAIAEIDQPLVFKARIDDSLGGQLSSYRDNLYVVDRFLSGSDSRNELQASAKVVKAKIYYDWAKDLAWHGHTAECILRSAQHLGYSRKVKDLLSIGKFVGKSLLEKKT